ncbi:hypothetical protein PpBr36_01110 [Pyricularia pennisetigena]|uniref:hypothetical protein n=1 Tax=Pyricularia pennisetigena TaxID=1578925 RepID=UPI001152D346|nr:hypothetical protein PpBr36_01110 [Pyricularia pennisetigena]TLS29505.1 hypothetical protein PpBr36_01110 [Pyricularia pennisetigena]
MAGGDDMLAPPAKTNTKDPGAHELESESDDHFSDAQSAPSESRGASPKLPKTRVEKVDNEPSFGEVPGTEAYQKRTRDAEPDEIAIAKDSSSAASGPEDKKQDDVSSEKPQVPLTVVEETVDSAGSITHSGTHHESDAAPDKVVKVDEGKFDEAEASSKDGAVDTTVATSYPSPPAESEDTPQSPPKVTASASLGESGSAAALQEEKEDDEEYNEGNDDDGDFGDDFDDFEEGGGDADDDDFGDFDDGFQEPVAPEDAPPPVAAPPPPAPGYNLSFPVPDFDGLDADAVMATTEPYLNAIYPPDDDDIVVTHSYPQENPIFQTPRSASLWAQLVAPPPLQPPDWIRSRIRRLFLVSLGVPVDLDEILPASKQKKLVLPSLNRAGSNGTPRTSTDSRNITKLKQEAGASTTSLDSQGNKKPRPSGDAAASTSTARKKNEPVEPELDLVSAKQLCMTTDEALDGMTDGELKEHVAKLQAIEGAAKELLEYWQKRTDEKIGDREAFEGVIESLVKHARKVRK